MMKLIGKKIGYKFSIYYIQVPCLEYMQLNRAAEGNESFQQCIVAYTGCRSNNLFLKYWIQMHFFFY